MLLFRSETVRNALVTLLVIGTHYTGSSRAQDKPHLIPLWKTNGAMGDPALEPIIRRARNSTIIGLSESTHGKNEPLDFRNILIKRLVKEKMIDVVALESGVVESRTLYNYVLNYTDANINAVMVEGLSWHFNVIPQNEELIRWLREYNADKRNSHKVKLYGFDVPGSPGVASVKRKMNTAYVYALEYLKEVDKDSFRYFNNSLTTYLPYLHMNFDDVSAPEKQYSQLPKDDRLRLKSITWELVKHFETHEIDYTKRSSIDDFAWAYRAAVNAQQVFNWLEYIPYGYKTSADKKQLNESALFHAIFHYRDRAMFDNLSWIMEREPDSKVFIFASTNHLLKVPVNITTDSLMIEKQVLGNYLDLKHQSKYLLIGNITANPELGASGIENVFLNDRHHHYYLDLSSYGPGKLPSWEELRYQNGRGKVDLYKAIDIILFDKSQTDIIFRK